MSQREPKAALAEVVDNQLLKSHFLSYHILAGSNNQIINVEKGYRLLSPAEEGHQAASPEEGHKVD